MYKWRFSHVFNNCSKSLLASCLREFRVSHQAIASQINTCIYILSSSSTRKTEIFLFGLRACNSHYKFKVNARINKVKVCNSEFHRFTFLWELLIVISKVKVLVIISMRFVKYSVKICTENKTRIEWQNCVFHLEQLLIIGDCSVQLWNQLVLPFSGHPF